MADVDVVFLVVAVFFAVAIIGLAVWWFSS